MFGLPYYTFALPYCTFALWSILALKNLMGLHNNQYTWNIGLRESGRYCDKIFTLVLSISATLSNVYLPYNKFGLNVFLGSTKFTQCQTVSRAALKSSINENIRELWSITGTNRNIQYGTYSNTKDVLKEFWQKKKQRLNNGLISEGSNIKNSTLAFNSSWSSVQSKLPKDNLTSAYVTLAIHCLRERT